MAELDKYEKMTPVELQTLYYDLGRQIEAARAEQRRVCEEALVRVERCHAVHGDTRIQA